MAPLAELIGPNGEAFISKSFYGDVKVEQRMVETTITPNTMDGYNTILSVDPSQEQTLRLTSDENGSVFDGQYRTRGPIFDNKIQIHPASSVTIESGLERKLIQPLKIPSRVR